MARIDDDDTIPLVTREEFDRIECNRCGVCCERIHQPSPLVLAQEIGCYALDKARWPQEAIEAMGLEDAMLDRERLIDWWSQFIPVLRVEVEGKLLQYEYRCSRFVGWGTAQGRARPTRTGRAPAGRFPTASP